MRVLVGCDQTPRLRDMANTDYVVASTCSDVIKAFSACYIRRELKTRFRCVHLGAVAAAAVICGIDPDQFCAGLCAAKALGTPLANIAAILLPSDAITAVNGRLVIVGRSCGELTTTRRWQSRPELIASIADAASDPSWLDSTRVSTAIADWNKRAARAGGKCLLLPETPSSHHAREKITIDVENIQSACRAMR